MSTTPTVVESPTIHEGRSGNGDAQHDWLDDPAEAWARERGPYTIENAEHYLDAEPVELYNGWLVWQEMTDPVERTVLGNIQDALSLSARKAGFGQILPDQVECLLSDVTTIKPDACLISWERLRDDVHPYGPNDRPTLMRCPELVVEVRAQWAPASNRRSQEARKRAMYFAQGTEIIWDVDEKNQVIYVYRAHSPEQPERFAGEDEIGCWPLLPNRRRRTADLFDLEATDEVLAGELAEEWREEGREEGIASEKRNIARTMLLEQMDPVMVARLTGLTAEQIESIQKGLTA